MLVQAKAAARKPTIKPSASGTSGASGWVSHSIIRAYVFRGATERRRACSRCWAVVSGMGLVVCRSQASMAAAAPKARPAASKQTAATSATVSAPVAVVPPPPKREEVSLMDRLAGGVTSPTVNFTGSALKTSE